MKIARLEVDAFGHFADLTLGPLESQLVVIHGPNEAGKTTLLAFLRTMLYGFAAAGRPDYRPALNGAPPGGRITLCDDIGRHYLIERHADVYDGRARLTLPDGSAADEAALRQLLGDLPGELYRHVYTLTVDELQRLAELPPDSLHDGLFEAALGLDRLRASEQLAGARARAIFGPDSHNGELPRLLIELDDLERRDGEHRAAYEAYAELRREHAAGLARIGQVEAELDAARRTLVALALVRNAWNDWVAYRAAERRLQELGPVQVLPEDLPARVDKLEAELRVAEREARRQGSALDEQTARAVAPLPDAALLAHGDEVEALRAGRPQFERRLRELPQRRADLQQLSAGLDASLAGLGPGWDAMRLSAFDAGYMRRDELRRRQRRFDELHAELDASQAGSRAAEQAWRAAEQDRETLTSQIDGLLADAPAESLIATRLTLVRRARERWARLELARRSLADEQTRLSALEQVESPTPEPPIRQRHPLLPLLAAVAAPALAALGWLLGGSALTLGLAAAAVLITLAVFSWFLGSAQPQAGHPHPLNGTAPQRQRVERAAHEAEAAHAAFRELATPLGITRDEDVTDLERIERSLEGARGRLRALDQLRGKLRESELAAAHSRQRLDALNDQHAALSSELAAAQAEWHAWLRSAALPEEVTPDDCAALLHRVDDARRQLTERDRSQAALNELTHELRRYQMSLTLVLASVGERAPESPAPAILAAVEQAITRYDQVRDARAQQRRLRAQVEAWRPAQAELEREAQALRDELVALLTAVAAASPAEVRALVQAQAELRELRRRQAAALERLQRLSGPGAAWLTLRRRLERTRYDELRAESAALTAQIAELEVERGLLLSRRGALDERLRQIERLARQDDLPQRRALLRTQLSDQLEAWLGHSTAVLALAEARRRFAIERRPAIISRARAYFSTFTTDNYDTIADVQGPDGWLELVDAEGRRKRVHELSRGTREQLFLAFRLASIEDFAARLGRLPVLLDDVLVNFDPARAGATVRSLSELSQRCQVLYFTCHPDTVARFAASDSPVQFIDLEGGMSMSLQPRLG